MKLTNKYNLPAPMVRALTPKGRHTKADISVTQLIQPPRIKQLTNRYSDKIQEDVSDRIWMLLGSAVHYPLEKADDGTTDNLIEHYLSMKVNGWLVSGMADVYEPSTGMLSDYKVTSVWSVMAGVKEEWEAQLNMYALMLDDEYETKSLQIVAILRDHNRTRAKTDDKYPDTSVAVIPIPLWGIAKTTDYITQRVKLHKESVDLSDDKLPLCTDADRWLKPTKYAVKKSEKHKRALRLFDTRVDAQTAMDGGLGAPEPYLEIRKGEATRCESFCPVRDYCNQYAEGLSADEVNPLLEVSC